MRTRQSSAIQPLLVVIIGNAVLLAVLYFLLAGAIQAAGQTLLFVGVGGLGTLLLAFVVYSIANRSVEPLEAPPAPRVAPETRGAATAERVKPVAAPERVRPVEPARTAEAGAVQMLAILQRQGRLIDFLQEDLSMYDDAQIGAAVRTIHDGSRKALAEHVKLEPVFQEAEGSSVTVQAGFDSHAVRLAGDIVGEPPFRGALRHRGWRVARIDLPAQAFGQDKGMVVAAAEIEVNA